MDKLNIIGLLSSYTLSEGRMAYDAARAAAEAAKGAQAAQESGTPAEPPPTYEELLRELVDERTYPRLYRLAWSPPRDHPRSEREEFLRGIDLILDGVQALIDQTAGGY